MMIGDSLLFRLTEHVQDKSKLPILIFPEGELRSEARQAPGGGRHSSLPVSVMLHILCTCRAGFGVSGAIAGLPVGV